jgi:hypothetical protein
VSTAATTYSRHSRRHRYRGLDLEVIRDPARALNDVREQVLDDLWRLVVCAWGDAAQYRTMVAERFLTCDLLTIARRGSEVVAFSAIVERTIAGRRMLILLGTVVDASCGGRGLSVHLNQMHIIPWAVRRGFRGSIAYRSQDPRMLGAALDRGIAYPHPWLPTPPETAAIAAEVGKLIAPDKPVCPRTLVMKEALPLALSHRPRDGVHYRPEVVAFCTRHLDYERGDAFIIVSRYTLRHLLRNGLLPLNAYRIVARWWRRLTRQRPIAVSAPYAADDAAARDEADKLARTG